MKPLVFKRWRCKACGREVRRYSQAPWWRRLFAPKADGLTENPGQATGHIKMLQNDTAWCGPYCYEGEFSRSRGKETRLDLTCPLCACTRRQACRPSHYGTKLTTGAPCSACVRLRRPKLGPYKRSAA